MKVTVKDQSCFIPVEGDLGIWGFLGGSYGFQGEEGGHQSLLTGRDFKKLTAN